MFPTDRDIPSPLSTAELLRRLCWSAERRDEATARFPEVGWGAEAICSRECGSTSFFLVYLSDGTGEERHLFSFTEKGNDLKLEEGGKEKRGREQGSLWGIGFRLRGAYANPLEQMHMHSLELHLYRVNQINRYRKQCCCQSLRSSAISVIFTSTFNWESLQIR